MKFSTAIFDMDGTLLDSSWVWANIDIEFQKMLNIRVSDDYYGVIAHMTTQESAAYTVSAYDLDMTVDELQKFWSDMALESYSNEVNLKIGARELLDDLKSKRIKLALATSCFPELCELSLTNLGIINKFDLIKYTYNTEKNKSNPDIYLSCAKELDAKPANCVVFEDISTPLEPVKNAGMGFIGVHDCSNKQMQDILKEKSDYYIESYKTFMLSDFYKNSF